jgi:glycosidase
MTLTFPECIIVKFRGLQSGQRPSGQFLEFHISRKAREHFNFDEFLFTLSGDLIFPNFRAVQNFAAKINEKSQTGIEEKTRTGFPGKVFPRVSSGEINAMALFHEVLHFVINSYVNEINPAAFAQLESWLRRKIGVREFENSTRAFVELFPSTPVYNGQESVEHYLSHSVGSISNRQVVLTELILLWLENRNPAFAPISQLIDDSDLKNTSRYNDIVTDADKFFETQPRFSFIDLPLLKMLRAPMEAHPSSITEQLQFMAKHWQKILARSPFLLRILTSVDILKEEGKYFLMLEQARADKNKIPEVRQSQFAGFGEKGSQAIPQYRGQEFESENFSTDLGWMPKLVLIAKSTFVWLDQLSKKYRRSISRLDQIPDEELDILADRGFTGLWLIGIWKRSHASEKIKHLNGNIDAIASAYSLNSYDISSELGGEEAFFNLRDRAMTRGIRLASDMVPNHMGIDSSWVINHPDWFLSADYSPFPNYTFNGPDLSNDDRVGIFIEDGYWTKRDAAVVFKRLDRWTGSVKYIYHGNDGTHMPWNDTAQLDFTKPEVREAVIRTILQVARKFSIIRFDAAMVLAKKHLQRLWFPEPGTGGAIPSRSNFSLTKEQFDAVIPNEFWREVVDRVQREVPDTLLLAEAFWLMEGYFVRTLGMHRVYNSAFMNMLKREQNANYRQVIKNVLEYNPQILKRFVNFINNPDEETAIAQFGKDDKYFGVCVMMATMPGLPMFGHGQVEGFTEKYGMEYKRAYRDENPDGNLVSRHEREVFPLLKKRRLFSEMDNFLMYDLSTGDGTVNEDVFAYSNRLGEEGTLVVYNNRYSQASGWIKNSVGFRDDNGRIIQKTLQDGLRLSGGKNAYCIFEDMITHVEYVRPVKLLRTEGLYVELGAYKYNVFVNFREVQVTDDKPYDEFCAVLNGKGVHSIEDAMQDYRLRDVHAAFYEAMNAGSLRYLLGSIEDRKVRSEREKTFKEKSENLISAASAYEHLQRKKNDRAEERIKEFGTLVTLPKVLDEMKSRKLSARVRPPSKESLLYGWRVLFLWLFLNGAKEFFIRSRKMVRPFEDWRLLPRVAACFHELGLDERLSKYESEIVGEILESIHGDGEFDLREIVITAIERRSVQNLLGVNVYDGATWFNKERLEDLLEYMALAILIRQTADVTSERARESKQFLSDVLIDLSKIEELAEKTKYRLNDFIAGLHVI